MSIGKHVKKAGGHIGWNVVEITMNMKTIVRKPLMIKIIKPHLKNSDNYKKITNPKCNMHKNEHK